MGATVHPIFAPNREQMMQHMLHLFGDQQKGMIEVCWTPPETREVSRAQLFDVGDLDKAVDFACEVNAVQGQCVYIGAALRKPKTFPAGRTKDIDYYGTTAAYVDLDDPGAAEAAKALYDLCRPTLAVVTGRTPHTRAQLWWKLEDAFGDPERHERLMGGIAAVLHGDSTVTNPSRPMRLGGTVAWPKKDGRVTEMTAVAVFADGRPGAVYADKVEATFPPAVKPGQAATDGRSPITGKLSPDWLIREIQAGRQWHNNMVRLVGMWLMRNMSDAEILLSAPALTLPGWSISQTAMEMQHAIDGGRRKWQKPDEPPQFDPETGEIKDEFGPSEETAPTCAASFLGKAPAREWLVQDWLPAKTVTSLYGDGGIGKTLLAQQLATAHAIGGEWCGIPIPKGRTLAVFCEDDRQEVWRRQDSIDAAVGISLRSAQLQDLFLWDRVGQDNILQNFNRDGVGVLRPFYNELSGWVEKLAPTLLILDTAADIFGGNELVRIQVNHFIKYTLASFIRRFNLTVLMLAHPSVSGMQAGTGAGASTAWNNSVRSRWYLEKVEGGLSGQRFLTRKKANYAASGDDQRIDLIWESGILTTKPRPDTVDRIELNSLKSMVSDVVEKCWDSGTPIGGNRSSRPFRETLPRLIKDQEPALIVRAFLELERDGYLSSQHGNTHKRGYKVMRNVRTGEMNAHSEN